jgi:Zn-dependent protease
MPLAATSALSNLFTLDGMLNLLMIILVLCISLSFHERSHAWAAYKLGDDTAALQGRLSLNPLVHLDLVGSLVFVSSLLFFGRGIGWAKPTPINPIRFNRRFSMKTGIILTSAAGPLSNLVLAFVAAILYFVTLTVVLAADVSSQSMGVSLLSKFVTYLYGANITLAVFNMLPVPPLDGFKVFGAILPGKLYYKLMQYERFIGLAFLVLVMVGGNLLSTVIGTISIPFDFVIFKPLSLLFTWIWQAAGLA